MNKSHRPSIARAATLPDFTQRACENSVKERPTPSAARGRWDAVLQGESELVQVTEIHPALLSIGVLNGQVCEQTTGYFSKSKPPSGGWRSKREQSTSRISRAEKPVQGSRSNNVRGAANPGSFPLRGLQSISFGIVMPSTDSYSDNKSKLWALRNYSELGDHSGNLPV